MGTHYSEGDGDQCGWVPIRVKEIEPSVVGTHYSEGDGDQCEWVPIIVKEIETSVGGYPL